MPSRPEKSVALYQSDQAESYDQAVRVLEERGKIDSDASEGEKLATLSRVAIEQTQTQETTSDGQQSGISWETLSFVVGIVGTFLLLLLILGGSAFVVSQFLF